MSNPLIECFISLQEGRKRGLEERTNPITFVLDHKHDCTGRFKLDFKLDFYVNYIDE